MKFTVIAESKSNFDYAKLYLGDELVDRFLKYRARLSPPENDIYFWINKSSADALEARLDQFEKISPDKVIGNWEIYKLATRDQLNRLIGRHKKWCIQNNADWEFYKNTGTQFILYKNAENIYIRAINHKDPFKEGIFIAASERINKDSILYKEIMSLPVEDLISGN